MELMLIRPNDQKQVYGDTKEFTACESPYWAMMIAAYLRNLNHDIAILDAEAEDLSPDQTASYVTNNNPNLIGLVVTGTNLSASTWKMEGARAAAVAIRNAGYDGKIFFWGLHPSALPEQTLREEPTDFVIKGEGFQTIHQLLENLNNSDLYEKIGGLYYKEKGRIKENPEISLIQNLDELPMQAFDMVDMKK